MASRIRVETEGQKTERDMPKSKDTEQERTCKVMRLLVEAESQSGPVIVDRKEKLLRIQMKQIRVMERVNEPGRL